MRTLHTQINEPVATHCADIHTFVFLHGFMGNSSDWNKVSTLLPDNYRCVKVDLPGHGKSLHFEDSDMTMAGTSHLLTATLEEINVEKYTLVGYSMGGRLALYHAFFSTDIIEKLIIESAHCGIADDDKREGRKRWDAKIAHHLQTTSFLTFLDDWYHMELFSSLRNCADFELMMAQRVQNDPIELARSMQFLGTGSMRPLWDRWAAYKQPTHLIAGQLDKKYVRLSTKMITVNQHATYDQLAGVGHNTHVEDVTAFIDILTAT